MSHILINKFPSASIEEICEEVIPEFEMNELIYDKNRVTDLISITIPPKSRDESDE